MLITMLLLTLLTAPAIAERSRGALADVLHAVKASRARGETPVVVFDLDDTLFRVAYRTQHILRTWTNLEPVARRGWRQKVDALDPMTMPYSLNQTLDRLGITDAGLRASAGKYWGNAFFSSDFLTVDRPLAGAPVYVHALKHAGAHIVYLTGRDEPRMGKGTRAALHRAGFPTEGVTYMLKPHWQEKDVVYKTRACEEIKKLGRVVASFDNEPKNLNMFQQVFPGALIVNLDTPHSENAPPLNAGIPTVQNYR
jgi:hypothetical protein